MKDTIKSFLSVAAVIAVFLTVQVYIELQDKSAEQTIHAQAAQITALNRTVSAVLAERDQARSDLAVCMTAHKPAVSDAAPASDSDYLTVIVAAVPSQSAPAQTDSAAPLVALGNLVRPGLGTVLGRLSAPPLAAGASPSATPTVARWAIVGKVVPYFGQSSGLVLTKYAWINIKTQAVEEHDVEPASALLGRLQGVR